MTANEVVRQKMLNGKELKEVLLNKLQESLAIDPMFQEHMAYGRLQWTVQITLQMDNPNYKEHKIEAKGTESPEETRPGEAGRNGAIVTEGTVELKVEDGFTSPNAARVQNGLPVPIEVRQGGKTEAKEVRYDKGSAPPQKPAPVQNLSPRPPAPNPASISGSPRK